ncbi:MAG: RloB family protein [Campylobacterota bacterium]|nr:RloB family protein [Campylobacterota bacterium]
MARRGGDKLHHRKKELEKKDFRRQTNNKSKVFDIIIACEDESSAPTYFRKIVEELKKERLITPDSFVIVKHKHTNPQGVLEDLKNYEDKHGKTYKDFAHKWIVIDRDRERVNGGGHKAEDFNNALRNAKNKRANLNVEVAYANDSFELWYLLHFDYINTPLMRDEINKRLIKKLQNQNEYKFSQLDKNSIKQANYTKHIFDEILPLQETAIQNAKNLLQSYGINHNPEQDNPSTTIYILVELLNNLSKESKS